MIHHTEKGFGMPELYSNRKLNNIALKIKMA